MRTASEKIKIFQKFFTGLTNVYGTYDPETGRAWQVKQPVTNDTVLAHLKGMRPYGVYLLTGNRTKAVVADFDDKDSFPPIEFLNAAQHYGLPSYIETSKSKGFHVWTFYSRAGVKSSKARLVVKNIIEEIEYPQTEIFPKQNCQGDRTSYGNFINAPLFGRLVPEGKTVFVDPYTLQPYPDQWEFLESVERVEEQLLDQIIELNNLTVPSDQPGPLNWDSACGVGHINRFRLPICAQKMLQNGVSQNQRVSCFRLAVNLKMLGMPFDLTVAALTSWAQKNRPINGKRIITEREINQQTKDAFNRDYRSYGCETEAVAPFCNSDCPVRSRENQI
jgi:hypothetical protein